MKIAIVGSGFSGAVLAHKLSRGMDCSITVFDERHHVAGNCHTERDVATGIMEHKYGPHIFHTSNRKVWDFVNEFTKFHPCVNRVKAVTPRGLFTLPINLLTINQFFGKSLRPAEAKVFIETIGDKSITNPQSFEDQALRFVGREMYENFFLGYTIKQWGVHPRDLPASILQRLPIRFNYDDNYYNSIYQGIPEEGYTAIVERLLKHPRVELKLNTKFERAGVSDFDHVFFTGPIDEFYGHVYGRLGYRTVYFERHEDIGDYLGNPVINYTAQEVPYTRVAEHKHFTPWENHDKTLVFFERSKFTEAGDIPYYPMRREPDKAMLEQYLTLARQESKVSFIGRLATYRYLDMHAVIAEALDFSEAWLSAKSSGQKTPVFPASI